MTDPSFRQDARDALDAELEQREPQPATHYITASNWHMALADAIEQAEDGDTIVVHNPSMKELAERVLGRMCPGKKIFFQMGSTFAYMCSECGADYCDANSPCPECGA